MSKHNKVSQSEKQSDTNILSGKENDTAIDLAQAKDEKAPVISQGEKVAQPKKQSAPRLSLAESDKLLDLTMQYIGQGQSKDDAKKLALETVLSERVTSQAIDRDALAAFVNGLCNSANTEDKAEFETIREAWSQIAGTVSALRETQAARLDAFQKQIAGQFGESAVPLVVWHVSYVLDGPAGMMLPANTVAAPTTCDVRERKPNQPKPDGWKRPIGFKVNESFDLAALTEKQSKMYAAMVQVGPDPDNGLWHNAQAREAYKLAYGEERTTNFNMVGEMPYLVPVYAD